MFGQSGNPSFGFNAATQNSPFGQSAFGKTIATTSFGTSAPPVFGSNTSLFNSKPTASAAGSLFANTTTTPTFGASTAPQSSFGGFGNANTNAPLFGTQQNSNTNLFGTSNAATTFGQANKPTTFGFGQPTGTGLFGQTQQQAAPQNTPFGQQTNTSSTSLFGNTSGFGGTNSVSGISGTVVKFSPVTGTDTMVKNGVTQTISTRHHCITCMKEYEAKSLEELRLEDYTAGRKGVTQGQASAIFGTVTQGSPFGTIVSNSNNTNSGFGSITSGFGNSSQSSSSSLFSKPITGFGVPVTTSSAFAFNSTTSSNLFNSQSKPFGATASTSLFATSNPTTSPANAFNNINTSNTGFAPGFSSGQSNQTIGLFTQNKPVFNIPSSTSTNFGFGSSSTTNTGSLFGSKPIGAGFGTTFAGTATSTFQPGTTAFGSTQNSNSTLFSNSFKPAGQSSGFTFGNNSSLGSTGLGSSGTSLFNSSTKPNLFGNPGTATTFNATGTFGSMSTFGSNGTAIPGLGTSLYGSGTCINNGQPIAGTVPVHQQILALVSAPFGDSPLLKNLLPASGKSEQFLKPSNAVSKNLSTTNYKILTGSTTTKLKPKIVTTTPLSKKSLFDGLEEEDPLLEAFQPRPNAKRLVLRPKSNSITELSEKIGSERCNHGLTEAAPQIVDKENEIQDSINTSLSGRQFSNSWLKSTLPRKAKINNDQYFEQTASFSITSELPTSGEELENTVTELRSTTACESKPNLLNNSPVNDIAPLHILFDKGNPNCSTYKNKSLSELDEASTGMQQSNEIVMNKANVKLQRHGYYTIPPLDMLDKYVIDQTCIVPHFTIGRKGYGNVHFADSFDVYGLNLDEIVHFRHKEVIIYPDDNVKPPIGQGLNRKAQVTLDRVWPHDKSCHEPITDPKRLIEMDYEGKLRRVSAKHDTRFLEYRPETGSWVFKVDHFSKYGLNDSDDDENGICANRELEKTKTVVTYKVGGTLIGQQCAESHIPALNKSDVVSCNLKLQRLDQDMYERQSVCSPTSLHARLMGTESHTLQLMKANFFEFANDNLSEDVIEERDHRFIRKTQPTFTVDKFKIGYQENIIDRSISESSWSYDNHIDLKRIKMNDNTLSTDIIECVKYSFVDAKAGKGLPMPSIRPKVAVLKFKSSIAPLSCSIEDRHRFKYIADIGLQMGNIFRSSWSPLTTLITLNSQQHIPHVYLYTTIDQQGLNLVDRYYDDVTSSNVIQCLQILGSTNLENNYIQTFKSSIEGHLSIQLEYSKVEEHPDCPIATVITSTSALHAHKTYSLRVAYDLEGNSLMSYFCDVWKLCEALWGNVSEDHSYSNNSCHEIIMLRKDALSGWLKLITAEIVQREVTKMESNDEIILSLLSANKLEEACRKALKVGDHCLALLLSQLGGTLTVRELIKQQIVLWQDTDVDGNFSIHRLKLFMLVAGMPIISKKNNVITVCENVDWKRAFAIHLWYISLPTASITDVLDLYEASFVTSGTKVFSFIPRPEYSKNEFLTEINENKFIYDLCYHLLKLYCAGNYSLEAILNSQTYTYDPLDYRLSWLLQQTLAALGYTHLSEYATALTHANFAAQLETFDLWHWAIFVVLHFKDSGIRRKMIIDLLSRHVELDKTPNYVERERFLELKLKIPLKWIYQAKAIKSCAMKRYGEAAWYFIHAQDWNKGHEIIMEYVATEAIINDDLDYLKSLLSLFAHKNCYNTISGWNYQGQLIWDYIIVTAEVKDLLRAINKSNINYKLELLRPQLTSLCTKIAFFPSATIKHRLCQAEMAKRTLQLVRGLLVLQRGEENTSNVLVHLISQLPLPEDYAQQELRPVINIYVNDVIL